MQKIRMICFGARENEQLYFKELNKYGYELTLVEELLREDNVDLIKGHNAVMLRGNCNAKAQNLARMKEMGVEYLLTRTAGTDHIDIAEAHKLGFKMARVPGYSPNAISELGVSLAMMLVRHTALMEKNMGECDFRVKPDYFSREIRGMTVAVMGVGKIGLESAKAFQGLGSRVIGYDLYPSEVAKSLIPFVELEQVQAEADLIILHMPYIKDANYHLINADFLARLKKGAILINMARGELVDTQAVIHSLKSGKLDSFGTDVLENEVSLFNKSFTRGETGSLLFNELLSLYPRVIVTPHVGSNTDEACRNMIEQSYDNLNDFLLKGECSNKL